MYCIGCRLYQRYLKILFWECLNGAFGSVDVWCSASVEVVGSDLARGKIFTASMGSVDSLHYLPPYIVNIYIYRCSALRNVLYGYKYTRFKAQPLFKLLIARSDNSGPLDFNLTRIDQINIVSAEIYHI